MTYPGKTKNLMSMLPYVAATGGLPDVPASMVVKYTKEPEMKGPAPKRWVRSSYNERHDPQREKTPEDLERIKAAEEKRLRKAEKKARRG